MKKLFLLCFLSLILFSCNNELPIDNPIEQEGKETVTFTYQGKTYVSDYSIVNDEVILEDQQAAQIYAQVMQIPTLCVVFMDDKFDLYDDESEYIQKSNRTRLNIDPDDSKLKAIGWAEIELYKTQRFQGECIRGTFYNTSPVINVPSHMNDEISSVMLKNYTVVFCDLVLYQHKNGGGAKFIVSTRPGGSVGYTNLKDHKINIFKNWNDVISSYKVGFWG